MRILYVIGDLDYGGAELVVADLAEALVGSGHRASVLVLGRSDRGLRERLERAGASLHDGGGSRWSGWRRLRRLVKSGQVDVVHAHLYPALYLCALERVGLASSARWVYTEHSTWNRRRELALLRLPERLVYARYCALTCVSPEAGRALMAWLPALRAPPEIISNGIDARRFECASPLDRGDLGIPPDARLLVSVGRLRQEKNHAVLLRALDSLSQAYHLVFAGDGPERRMLESLAGELGLADRVHWLGNVSCVERLLAAADLLLLVSRVEGFGLSAMEAVAAGLPLIFSDSAPLRALYEDYGFAVDPADAGAIAATVRAVCERGLRRESSAGAREKLLATYSQERMVGRYLELYGRLANAPAEVEPCAE